MEEFRGSVHVRVLERAAGLLGGKGELRAHLRVSMQQLEEWMAGRVRPPSYVFLKAVDLIASTPEVPGPLRRAREAREKAARALERSAAAMRRSAELLEALKASVKASGAQRGNIQAVFPEGLRIVTQYGFEKPFLDFFSVVRRDTPSSCGPAAAKAQRIVVPEVATHPFFAGTDAAGVMAQAGAAACQSTPLVDVSGTVIGMLNTHYEKEHEPTAVELRALDELARGASRLLAL